MNSDQSSSKALVPRVIRCFAVFFSMESQPPGIIVKTFTYGNCATELAGNRSLRIRKISKFPNFMTMPTKDGKTRILRI